MKNPLTTLLPSRIRKSMVDLRNRLFDGYALKSYSQEGEDMILRRIFEEKAVGFYVDIGAHHPKRFSNTYLFYKKGWRGINVDAMPGSMDAFRKARPRDINIETPITKESKTMTYYIFNEPALNGFDKRLSEERDSQDNAYQIIQTIELKTNRLEQILDQYLPENTKIDFLSIDVEGLDFEVLQSNNWHKYKPQVILVEVLGKTLADLTTNTVTKFLGENGYEIYAKAVNTVIFKQVSTQ